MKSFEFCICIGRFQPFHHGHHEVIREALNHAETVLIMIGSANQAPNIQNPWTVAQREEMITSALSPEELARIKFTSVRDYWYLNNRWLTEVQQLVYGATEGVEDSKICLIGEENFFPQWHFIKMHHLDRMPNTNTIRGLYFTHDVAFKAHVKESVVTFLEDFKKTASFKNLKEEYNYVKNYRMSWEGAPFPPTFVTVDAIVVKSGHVLMVRRKGNPGRGLIALPGGFLNQKETTLEGALRELKEETGIKVSKEDLEKSITETHVFDYPGRSLRGRTITHAFLIDLGNSGSLPIVKGSDDAEKAFWMSLSDFATRESEFFEDHWHITTYFCMKF